MTALGPDGTPLPGRNEFNNGFHAFLENEADTDNDPNWTNVKYDPISDSFIVVFADTAGETKVIRFTVVSRHLEQEGGGEPTGDFNITGINTLNNTQVEVSWSSEVGTSYVVQTSADGRDWQDTGNAVAGSPGTTSGTVTQDKPIKLIRVRTE